MLIRKRYFQFPLILDVDSILCFSDSPTSLAREIKVSGLNKPEHITKSAGQKDKYVYRILAWY